MRSERLRHICAKHIVSAGIKRVIYIEPYPKSLATQLYPDSIMVEPLSKDGYHVMFEPFVGVSPIQYMSLFTMLERKDANGFLTGLDAQSASPRSQSSPPTYLRNEKESLFWLERLMNDKGLKVVGGGE